MSNHKHLLDRFANAGGACQGVFLAPGALAPSTRSISQPLPQNSVTILIKSPYYCTQPVQPQLTTMFFFTQGRIAVTPVAPLNLFPLSAPLNLYPECYFYRVLSARLLLLQLCCRTEQLRPVFTLTFCEIHQASYHGLHKLCPVFFS